MTAAAAEAAVAPERVGTAMPDSAGCTRPDDLPPGDRPLPATFEGAGIGIVEVDAEGRLTRVNAGLTDLTGYRPDELVGRSIFDPALTPDSEADRAQFLDLVAGTLDQYKLEKPFRRKGGGIYWASVTSTAVRDPQGRFLLAVRTLHDITERKRAEAALARRIEQQAALYDFTEELQRADSLDRIFAAGLEAIRRALRCDRAAILLFDPAGFLAFQAWHGLSDSYRKAVEGHTPWPADCENPLPICYGDVGASDLAPALKAVIAAEGIGAVTFIPLEEKGRLLGKFMAYYDRPHDFSEGEVETAVTLGRQLGFGVARFRSESERRAAERAAHQLAAIVESSDDAIVSKDLSGIITTWNCGAERLFGYTAAEAVGRPVTILIPEDRLDEEPGILRRICNGERIEHFETVRRRKDGRLIDISLTISPIRDSHGRILGASKIARDITGRKLADLRLRESERRLQDLIAAIPAAIYTTDAAGRITYFNEAAVALAGRRPVIGSDDWCVTWKLYNPDGTPLPHDQCPMAVALKEGRPIRDAEAVAERPDGTRVPFIPYPTPLRDEGGAIVGAINMLVDISERKQAETQQRLLLNELNHRVKNNMQMLQSLLMNAAHETKSQEARRILADAGHRLAAMAAAQRVLYGTTRATEFDAREFLDAVCDTVRQGFPKPVAIACQADAVTLSNDAAMPLALILNELLTNAVKHGLQAAEKGEIRVALRRDGDALSLSVSDDGPGFDLESARTRSSGLRLVEGLARQLRGRFEVRCDDANHCILHFTL